MKRKTLAEADAAFRVGMRVTGPPEAFGLPPDPRSGVCADHRHDGAYTCALCYPPQPPVVVTEIDFKAGRITLNTKADPRWWLP